MTADLVSRLRDGTNEQHWVLRADAADELERLRARERQAATILATALAGDGYLPQHEWWRQEAAEWLNGRPAVDSLRLDAARYRWLRSEDPNVHAFWQRAAREKSLTLEIMDRVIDTLRPGDDVSVDRLRDEKSERPAGGAPNADSGRPAPSVTRGDERG